MKTKQQFFEWVGITCGPWGIREGYPGSGLIEKYPAIEQIDGLTLFQSCDTGNEDADCLLVKESPDLLWFIVDMLAGFNPPIIFQGSLSERAMFLIESATGKKWPEILEFLEDLS